MSAMNKVAFLDRDGTINVDTGTPVFNAAHWQWEEKVFEALELLQNAGLMLTVVTNQTGIGHQLYSEQEMLNLHAYMKKELLQRSITLAAIAYCPHHREGNCNCRKPQTGMATQIEKEIGPIDYAQSWMIGDKIADLQFGKNIGAQTALIKSSYWQPAALPSTPDLVVESLFDAATKIVTL